MRRVIPLVLSCLPLCGAASCDQDRSFFSRKITSENQAQGRQFGAANERWKVTGKGRDTVFGRFSSESDANESRAFSGNASYGNNRRLIWKDGLGYTQEEWDALERSRRSGR